MILFHSHPFIIFYPTYSVQVFTFIMSGFGFCPNLFHSATLFIVTLPITFNDSQICHFLPNYLLSQILTPPPLALCISLPPHLLRSPGCFLHLAQTASPALQHTRRGECPQHRRNNWAILQHKAVLQEKMCRVLDSSHPSEGSDLLNSEVCKLFNKNWAKFKQKYTATDKHIPTLQNPLKFTSLLLCVRTVPALTSIFQ